MGTRAGRRPPPRRSGAARSKIRLGLAAALTTLAAAPSAPAEERCSPRAGATLGYSELLRLADRLPPEVWRERDAFFHRDMQMEIGPCRRAYPPADSFVAASELHAGRARLDAEGNLHDHVAGLPFPPASIDANDPLAGARWAWNLERRYRGAGPRGSFRIVDFPSRVGSAEVYTGRWFHFQTAARADLAASAHRVPGIDAVWIAGGRFLEPSPVRRLGWRQRRHAASAGDPAHPDETTVYLPESRKTRRSASAWVDGLFTPRYRADSTAARALPVGGGGVVSATNSQSEHLARGFVGLALRPNAYRWQVVGEREVLAPINVARGGYPDSERDFGPRGLSLGDERWEQRRVVVIRGTPRERGRRGLRVHLDRETQQPLFWIETSDGGRLASVGILVHRYSGDRVGYPRWPDGSAARVFDPVAAVFVDLAEGGSGWRRESYDLVSTPPDPEEFARRTAPRALERAR